MKLYTDRDIISLIKYGEREKAIGALYEQLFPKIKSFIQSKGGGPEDAKDIFQEAVLKTYLKVIENKIEKENLNLSGLIMKISKDAWVDKVRRDKKIEFKEASLYEGEMPINREPSFLSFFTKEKNELVETVLSSIGEKCKQLLSLTILYNLSMEDIALRLGFSNEESAKTQHYKCKQKLVNVYKENHYLRELLKGALDE